MRNGTKIIIIIYIIYNLNPSGRIVRKFYEYTIWQFEYTVICNISNVEDSHITWVLYAGTKGVVLFSDKSVDFTRDEYCNFVFKKQNTTGLLYTYHWKVYGFADDFGDNRVNYNIQYLHIQLVKWSVWQASQKSACLFKSTLRFAKIFYHENNHKFSLLCIDSSNDWD